LSKRRILADRRSGEAMMGALSLRLGNRLQQWIAGWRETWRRRELREVEPEALERGQREAGRSWVDFRLGRPGARVDFERMLDQFGIDPQRVAPRYLAALRDAERVCGHCWEVGRCRRWLARGPRGDGPWQFCPNAAVLEEIAAREAHRSARRAPQGPFRGSPPADRGQ
jgi:hypothetical protein